MEEPHTRGTREGFKGKNTEEKLSNSLSYSYLDFLSLIISTPLCCLPPSFIASFPLPPAILTLVGFGGYLSYQPYALLFLDHERELLRVLPLSRPVIQHLMRLILGKGTY